MKRRYFLSLLLVATPAFTSPSILQSTGGPTSGQSDIRFQEIGSKAGINGVTICGSPQKTAVIEVNGGGVCWLDYNKDGFLDLFVVNGSTLEAFRARWENFERESQPSREASAFAKAAAGRQPARRSPNVGGSAGPPEPRAEAGGGAGERGNQQNDFLYRNNGDGTFTDVTEQAGIRGEQWGTGCAAADYDSDGDIDLFVANVGECNLYQNQGGTFVEIAKKAGVSGGFNWHTGVAFGDYDADGYLDLYVAAYVDPSEMLKEQKRCDWRGLKVLCGPAGMKGAPDALYRNNRDGTFTNVTREAGVEDRDLLYGFTASFEDFDNDGKLDIFVANDVGRNYLYHNLGKGRFEEVGETWGIAYPAEAKTQANMGVAIADYDRSGTMDVFVTTFSMDHYTLYKNLGNRLFVDATTEAGLSRTTFYFLGWGTFFADFNNDGALELFATNGHIYPEVDQLSTGLNEGYAQRALLFEQSRPGFFQEITSQAGLADLKAYSSRGAACADYDSDGDLDIVYTHMQAAPTLLENVSRSTNHWITIRLLGAESNRDGIGARLKLSAGGLVQYATARSGESYLSGNDPRIHFGLGKQLKVDRLEIHWPSGRTERIDDLQVDRIVTVLEGKRLAKKY